jgi:hypothetical protein
VGTHEAALILLRSSLSVLSGVILSMRRAKIACA